MTRPYVWSVGSAQSSQFPCLDPPLTWLSFCLKIASNIIGLGSLPILKDRIWLLVLVLELSVTFLCMYVTFELYILVCVTRHMISLFLHIIVP